MNTQRGKEHKQTERTVRRAYDRALAACRKHGNSSLPRAVAAGRRAVELGKQLGPADEGSALAHLAYLIARTDGATAAEGLIAQAIALVAPLGDRHRLGKIYGSRGAIENNCGKPLAALRSYIKALELVDADTFVQAAVLDGLGFSLQLLGRPREAVQYLLRAIGIYESLASEEPPSASSYGAIASIYHELGDMRRASQFLAKAERAAIRNNDRLNLASAHLVKATIALERDQSAQALRSIQKAERLSHALSQRMYSEARFLRARYLPRASRYQEALDVTLLALKSVSPDDDQLLESGYTRLGDIHRARSAWSEAIAAYQSASKCAQQNGTSAFELARSIAQCYDAKGETALAYQTLARASDLLAKARTKEISRGISVEKELVKLRRGSTKIEQLEEAQRSQKSALASALAEIVRLRRVMVETTNVTQRARNNGTSLSSPFRPHGIDLTVTERRVCEMLQFALSTKEIAVLLSVSTRTIEWHRASIRKKLGLMRSERMVDALESQRK